MGSTQDSSKSQRQLVWLITGTTAGFGQSLVLAALSRGDCVIATARSPERLQKSFGRLPESLQENLRTFQLDITEGEESLKLKVQEAASYWGRIDVLVNNAGFATPGLIEEGGSTLFRRQYEVNVFGMLDMTTATLPFLRASKGYLVNVGSRSAWKTDMPGIGPYISSKAAVHAFSETLATELAPLGVRVLIVAPGPFRTEGMYSQKFYAKEQIAQYDNLREAQIEWFTTRGGTEKGDPAKAMDILVDVVRGEGRVAGKEFPKYLFLGEEALEGVASKSKELLQIVEDWKEIGSDVNFD